MNKSILKLLWSKNKKSSVFLASIGLFIGFFVVLISINLYFILTNTINKDETLFSKDYIVINKKISLLNTIKLSNSDFTGKELEELKKQPFVKSFAPFVSNTFKIGAYTEATKDIPGFYTELFFQSVPDKYLNIKDKRWHWERGQEEIPIIFPGDYLKLYNFGFAKSQGLPQISASTISKVSFTVRVKGQGFTDNYRARIIGLTDKINSILVPQSFMDFANKKYGNPAQAAKTSMVLIEAANPSDPAIFSYLKEHNYETNTEKIKNSKSTVFLKMLFGILSGFGLVIILLSMLLFVLSFNLIVVKSTGEIRKLLLAGYHYKQILKYYALILLLIIAALDIAALFATQITVNQIVIRISDSGFAASSPTLSLIVLPAFILSLFIYGVNIVSLALQLKRIN